MSNKLARIKFSLQKRYRIWRFISPPTRHIHNSIQFHSLILLVCDSQVVSSLVFTVVAGLLCFSGAVFTGTEVAPLFSGIDKCQYYPVETSCKCFHQSELRQVSIIFRGTVNCNGIQFKLSSLVYGMSGVYAGGVLTCIIATVMETMFLCRRKPSKVRIKGNSLSDIEPREIPRQKALNGTLRYSAFWEWSLSCKSYPRSREKKMSGKTSTLSLRCHLPSSRNGQAGGGGARIFKLPHWTFLNCRLRIKIASVTQSKITSKCTQ